MLTAPLLAQACDCPIIVAQAWAPLLDKAMARFGIDTPARAAAFLAQIAHESVRLRAVREIWGPTAAQRRYEGRKDLGNTEPGDGYTYRGRGLIQVTGRANYAAVRDGLRRAMADTLIEVPDFEARPELLEVPQWAALSAAWYWAAHALNDLADAGRFESITRRINGGLNGHDDRLALWAGAKAALATA